MPGSRQARAHHLGGAVSRVFVNLTIPPGRLDFLEPQLAEAEDHVDHLSREVPPTVHIDEDLALQRIDVEVGGRLGRPRGRLPKYVAGGSLLDQGVRVGGQQEALLDGIGHRGLHRRDVPVVIAIALLQREPRVAGDGTVMLHAQVARCARMIAVGMWKGKLSNVQCRERLLEKGWGWVFGAATCVALTAAIGCATTPETAATVAAGRQRQERLAERAGMVELQISERGVNDPRVLRAMRSVPRHQFVPENLQQRAYDDTPLPIGHDQTISQPFIVAYMTEALRLPPNAKVLDVGTGSGYQAAVLAEVAREVFSIEILPELADSAATKLEQLGYENIHVRQGDGYRGWPEEAPFDGIIVAAAPDHVPEALVNQLAVGARLVIPVGDASQTMTIVTKTAEGASLDTTFPVRFVPMTGEARERR